MQREVAIMKSLDHPNVIKLFDFIQTHSYYYLVMELMAGGELFDRIVERTHYTERWGPLSNALSCLVFCLTVLPSPLQHRTRCS